MELLPRGGTWHQMSEIKGGIGPREERFLEGRQRQCYLFNGAALLVHGEKFKWYRPMTLLHRIELSPADPSVLMVSFRAGTVKVNNSTTLAS